MSHISRVGRRSWRVRVGLGALYAVLIAGAVTTVYPFLQMISTATKSQTDYTEYNWIIPRYWFDGDALYQKYLEDRYANNIDDLNDAHHATYAKLTDAVPPRWGDRPGSKMLRADWSKFVDALPVEYKKAGFGEHDNAPSSLLMRYREHLREKFNDKIDVLNRAWSEENAGFDNVTPPFERTTRREWTPDRTSLKMTDWLSFKASLPQQWLIVAGADPLYRRWLREERFEDDLAALNRAWGTNYPNWNAIALTSTAAATPAAARRDWETFIRTKYPLRLLTLTPSALPAWRRFLAERNRPDAATAAFPDPLPASGTRLTDWMEFIARPSTTPSDAAAAPVTALVANSPENQWRADVAERYGSVAQANAAYQTKWKGWWDAHPPQVLQDWDQLRTDAASIRAEFATRNFRSVFAYILLHGRAVGNTVLFCLLSILAAVIVNPLCAYALSRFPLSYANRVLLFLLATMAFPAEVAMIPNFLLLRDLGMLNTFWALVLPGLASGFSIFLLKGFFDSLPRELYEAGILDGAAELTMFRRITVPLSMPIFSVIALGAFTASYGAFLFAMVVCQDPSMWTLMVWLYNLQGQSAPQYVVMAALTLASLPTLIVFLFAQRVILRGIILPSFK